MRRLAFVLLTAAASAAAQTPITIRAGTLIDGRGGVQRNVTVTIEGSKISHIGAANGTPTHDFSRLTLLPGLIDTHVHIDGHFGKDGRASNTGETPRSAAETHANPAGLKARPHAFTRFGSVRPPIDQEAARPADPLAAV